MNRTALVSLVGLALFLTACPIGPFAGGRLSGDVHSGGVADWAFVEDVETCQLETNPDDPHSVNTWCLGWEGDLYVPTSMILGPTDPSERDWVVNVQSDPAVRVRVEGVVYELEAERVMDDEVYGAVLAALEEKYDADPADREAEREIWLFRLRER